MSWPQDLTFDPAGSVYVADYGNHRVQVFSQNGKYLRTFDVRGWEEFTCKRYRRTIMRPCELSDPVGIHVDHDHVYVAEEGRQSRILIFHSSGEFITSLHCEELTPRGITTDQDGFLYVCDTYNRQIQLF